MAKRTQNNAHFYKLKDETKLKLMWDCAKLQELISIFENNCIVYSMLQTIYISFSY